APAPLTEPCVMVIFGATGDLTKRLLLPAVYNLACDGLLSERFAILGVGRSEITDAQFRASMTDEKNGLRAFHTRKVFDEARCDDLVRRLHFCPAGIDVADFRRLKERVAALDAELGAQGNVLFY